VFHNAAFDTRFLQTAVAPRKAILAQRFCTSSAPRFARAVSAINTLARMPTQAGADVLPVVCTQSLFRVLFPRQPYDLDSALRFVAVPLKRDVGAPHRAAEDARLAGDLFRSLVATAADVVESDSDANDPKAVES
jgi:DNA polymerase III epsilon subunit-like protein